MQMSSPSVSRISGKASATNGCEVFVSREHPRRCMSYTSAIKWSIPCPERMAIIRLVGAVLARRTMNVLRAAVKWVSKSSPVPEDGKSG